MPNLALFAPNFLNEIPDEFYIKKKKKLGGGGVESIKNGPVHFIAHNSTFTEQKSGGICFALLLHYL